jgi:hypothetical protein
VAGVSVPALSDADKQYPGDRCTGQSMQQQCLLLLSLEIPRGIQRLDCTTGIIINPARSALEPAISKQEHQLTGIFEIAGQACSDVDLHLAGFPGVWSIHEFTAATTIKG